LAGLVDWQRLVQRARRAHIRLLLYMTPIHPEFDNPESTPAYQEEVSANLAWLETSLGAKQPDRLLNLSFYLQRSELLAGDPTEHLDPTGMRRLAARIADEIVSAGP
jgi:hypothetical protein